MKSRTASSFGELRCGVFRGAGNALLMASRTMRRWTLNFLATPEIVPTPNSYSRRISSNSSTLFLLFIEEASLVQILSKEALRPKGSGGPNQGAEMGQFRVPNSHLGTGKPFSSVQATESHKNALLKTSEISLAPGFSRSPISV